MVFDPLSPIAPARVRMLLLPVGRVKRARFLSFIGRLQPENVVRLGDISPDGRPNRNMFSPLAFPAGMIVYDFTTSFPPASHLALSPFEIYREPLAVVAIADGNEMIQTYSKGNRGRLSNGNVSQISERQLRELDQELEALRDQYPKILVHQLLIFDYAHPSTSPKLPDGLVAIPSPAESKFTTMKTVMCDISAMLLAEMTTLAKSLQGMSMIESPCQGQGTRVGNGQSWPAGQADALSRSNSQYTSGSRSQSPAGSTDRSHVRMSMPAQLRPGLSETSSPSRPTTPLNDSLPVGTRSLENDPISRVNTTEKFREHSRDRISVQGFGSGSLNKQSRNKGRIIIVVGSLYLQAGRWGDALRELVDGAVIAQSSNDHLWHAKALENMVVAMLMLGWAGQDFKIPQICYLTLDKSPYDTPPNTVLAQSNSASPNQVALLGLAALLPDLLDRILSKHQRITGESLPQLPLSEIIIRFSKLLASLHLSGGRLDEEVLSFVVLGAPFNQPVNVKVPRLNIHPTRSTIIAVLFRAFPSSSAGDDLAVVDRVAILGSIASVLDFLGYYRKKAMVMRELISVLIPALIQARKIGAAEAGVHPAAGLSTLNAANSSTNGTGAFELSGGDVETRIDGLLSLMARTYGIMIFRPSLMGDAKQEEAFDDSDEAVVARIVSNASLRTFGGQNIKMNVLRACINLAEALPDFQGVLTFSSDLLRTAGSGIAPGARSENASPSMAREEQVRLAMNITRTMGAARKLGLHNVEAEYWDEFLVRGVDLEAQSPSQMPVSHQRQELSGAAATAESTERNPFIYNPFLVRPDPTAAERLLVAEETARFRITLQNPYEFDIEVEKIRLESEGVDFTSEVQNTVIGPYRTQIMTISGTPKTAGSLIIKGCLIKVRGCRERRFPIFSEPWEPQCDTKVKAIGLAAIRSLQKRPISTTSVSRPTDQVAPKVSSLKINVIDRQPVIIIKSTTLSQSATMVLEGERQTFSITLYNISNNTPTDLLLFSFHDSTQAPLQVAMNNKDASATELYEYELIMSQKQALRWLKRGNDALYINPGGTATFEFEILGKAGLTSAIVQVDYAYLGVPVSEVQERFYTRQVTLPLTVTVNASVELARMDILPLTGGIPRNIIPDEHPEQAEDYIHANEYFLLLLDLRNAWPSHLQVNLEITTGQPIERCILPGNTSRVVFPIKRIYIENPYAAIPTLDPTRQRQFVVSTATVSADLERTTRETFWYREEILKTLRGTWKTISGQTRSGTVELRGIRLNPRMVEAIKIEDIGVELSLGDSNSDTVGGSKYEVKLNNFVNLKVRITNRTAQPLYPLLRLQPSLRHQAHNLSLDLSKKLVWDGTLQRALPFLAANGTMDTTVGFTALCRGEFEISASVEEVRLWQSEEKGVGEATGRQRANTKVLMDSLLGAKERRIWHAREPCVLVVRESESSDAEM